MSKIDLYINRLMASAMIHEIDALPSVDPVPFVRQPWGNRQLTRKNDWLPGENTRSDYKVHSYPGFFPRSVGSEEGMSEEDIDSQAAVAILLNRCCRIDAENASQAELVQLIDSQYQDMLGIHGKNPHKTVAETSAVDDFLSLDQVVQDWESGEPSAPEILAYNWQHDGNAGDSDPFSLLKDSGNALRKTFELAPQSWMLSRRNGYWVSHKPEMLGMPLRWSVDPKKFKKVAETRNYAIRYGWLVKTERSLSPAQAVQYLTQRTPDKKKKIAERAKDRKAAFKALFGGC